MINPEEYFVERPSNVQLVKCAFGILMTCPEFMEKIRHINSGKEPHPDKERYLFTFTKWLQGSEEFLFILAAIISFSDLALVMENVLTHIHQELKERRIKGVKNLFTVKYTADRKHLRKYTVNVAEHTSKMADLIKASLEKITDVKSYLIVIVDRSTYYIKLQEFERLAENEISHCPRGINSEFFLVSYAAYNIISCQYSFYTKINGRFVKTNYSEEDFFDNLQGSNHISMLLYTREENLVNKENNILKKKVQADESTYELDFTIHGKKNNVLTPTVDLTTKCIIPQYSMYDVNALQTQLRPFGLETKGYHCFINCTMQLLFTCELFVEEIRKSDEGLNRMLADILDCISNNCFAIYDHFVHEGLLRAKEMGDPVEFISEIINGCNLNHHLKSSLHIVTQTDFSKLILSVSIPYDGISIVELINHHISIQNDEILKTNDYFFLHIDRNCGGRCISTHKLNSNLDLIDTSQIKPKLSQIGHYFLLAAIMRDGDSVANGHYYIKCMRQGVMYKIDDRSYTAQNLMEEDFEKVTVLMYQKVK